LTWSALGVTAVVMSAAFAGNGMRGSSTNRPADSDAVVRYEREIYLANPRQGCRWQPSQDASIQVLDCGDERDSLRVVFDSGRVTEYHVVVKVDPNVPTPTPFTGVTRTPTSRATGGFGSGTLATSTAPAQGTATPGAQSTATPTPQR
jgi:hypothetical protein